VSASVTAAIAEAAVWCLPLHTVVSAGSGTAIPLALFLPSFVSVFAVAVALACRYRSSPRVGTFTASAGMIAGLVLGRGSAQHVVFIVLVFLLLGIRAIALAFRDWREPIATSFLVGALALVAEAVVATAAPNDWSHPLIILTPVFFIGSLISRAVSVWSSHDAEELMQERREHWLRRSVAGTAWIPVAMLIAVVLGVRGGALDHVGSVLAPVGNALVSLLVFVFSQLSRPIFWLVDRLGIDPEGVRRVFARIQANADRAGHRARQHVGHPSLLGRMLGLTLFVLAAWGLIRFLRRLRPETTGEGRRPSHAPVTAISGSLPAPPDVVERTTRREPPADRVRRWYAEVLAALARRGVQKDPSLTPAEFGPQMSAAYPECAEAFGALTRAYEDVRYGSLQLDRAGLRLMEEHRKTILAAIRRREPGLDE
jgi:hypothetical protein